jgi:hypothetical protein
LRPNQSFHRIANAPGELSDEKRLVMMDDEYRRPKRGDNPFLVKTVEPDSPTWAALHFLASLTINDSFLAAAFKEAGDRIVEDLARAITYEFADRFFMPIAYLYRHSLELKMKEVARLGIDLQLIPDDEKTAKTLVDHNLHKLWNLVRKAVEAHWPNDSDVGSAERIVLEFHKIDETGQNLRYSKDKSGRNTIDGLPKAVQLTHVKDVFEGIFNFLYGVEAGFDHAIEVRNEMSSYENYE